MRETGVFGVVISAVAALNALKNLRARIRPDIRQAIDSFGVLVAVTLFFCLLNSAYDSIVNRNRQFDSQRWCYPIYRLIRPHDGFQQGPPAWTGGPIATLSRIREPDHNTLLGSVGECRASAHVMTEPAKRVPKWIRLDITVLAAGAVMIASALWLESNRDDVVQRLAHSAHSTGHLVWHYVTERKKPVVPKLKAPL